MGLAFVVALAALILRGQREQVVMPPRPLPEKPKATKPRVDEPAPIVLANNFPTPIPVEWPELRRLDEQVHIAHELSRAHDHLGIRQLLPVLKQEVEVVLASPIPRLPGADEAWMKRRVAALRNNRDLLARAIDEQIADDPRAVFQQPTGTVDLHATVNTLVDNVEVLMGATASHHQGITRDEHVHTDHQCGP